jgi:hypothetical protein
MSLDVFRCSTRVEHRHPYKFLCYMVKKIAHISLDICYMVKNIMHF